MGLPGAGGLDRLREEVRAARERLIAARRELPPEPVRDYDLRLGGSGAVVRLAALFGGKRDMLLIHNMGRACRYCTLWADGFAGLHMHLADRASFVLSSPDEPDVVGAFAATRRWPFMCVSHAGTTLAADLGYSKGPGSYQPGVSALRLGADGSIARVSHESFGPGDDFCALWPMLDLLREGPAGWEPKYAYGGEGTTVPLGRG